MNKIITVLSLVMVGVILVVMAIGCGGGEEPKKPLPAHIQLVPEGVDLVAGVKISEMLDDPDIAGSAAILSQLDMLEEETGLALRDFEEGVIFGSIAQDVDSEGYFAGIVKGTFKRDSLLAAIGDVTGGALDSVDYNSYKIFTNEAQDPVIAFLSDAVFVIGSMQPVKDIIDVIEGTKPAVSGMVLDSYNDLGDTLIRAVWELPADYNAEDMSQLIGAALGNLPIPVDIAPLLDIEAVGFTYNTVEESAIEAFKFRYPTVDAAQQAQTTINGLLGVLPMLVGSGFLPLEVAIKEAVLDLIAEIEISSSASWLTISLEMTAEELEDLVGNFLTLE